MGDMNSTIGRAANCTVDSATIVGHNVFSLYCAFKSFFYLENNKNLCIMMSGIYVKLIFLKSMSQLVAQNVPIFGTKVLIWA